jgi:transposase
VSHTTGERASKAVACDCGRAHTQPRTDRPAYPTDLSDEAWAIAEPLLPPPGNTGGRGGVLPKWCPREILDGLMWFATAGCAWSMIPPNLPPRATLHKNFQRFGPYLQRIRDAINLKVRERLGREATPSLLTIDSRSSQGASSVHSDTRGFDGGKLVNGRKVHIATDTEGLVHHASVTPANIADCRAALELYEGMYEDLQNGLSRLDVVLADGAYDRKMVDKWFAEKVRGFKQTVVTRPEMHKFVVIPMRWVVERTFSWFAGIRRLNRAFETKIENHLAMVHLASIRIAARKLSKL